MNAQVGARFGRYEVRGLLGRGGFATVFRAWDPLLGREVALKALLPHHAQDPDVRGRFLSEAQALARLSHPHIVAVHDVGLEGEQPYFAMELVEGAPLTARLGAPLPLAEAVALLAPLASALDYLHAAGIVHRDIKAANVMLDRSGRLVLMDFGIARALDGSRHTQTGALLGTPESIAPEQVRGEPAGPPADIYALGVLAYQLLAGGLPFRGDTARLLYAHVHEPPPPLERVRADVPPHAAAAVAAALTKDPRQRPPSAGAFVAGLTGVRPLVAPPYTPTDVFRPEPAASPARRGAGPLLLFGGAAVAAVVAVAVLLAVLLGGRSAGEGEPARDVAASVTQGPAGGGARATPAAASTPAVTELVLYDQVVAPGSRRDAFVVTGDTIAACFKLTQGRGAGDLPVMLVVTRDAAPPPSDGHPTVLARTEQPITAADTCKPLRLWTRSLPAPSTYYVWALAGGNVVGRAEFRAEATPTPAPTPVPTRAPAPPAPPLLTLGPAPSGGFAARMVITEVRAEGVAWGGSTFVFRVTAENHGGPGGRGSITVSSPSVSSLRAEPGSCGMTATPSSLAPGARASIYDSSRATVVAGTLRYPMAEINMPSWPAGASCTLIVFVPLPASGEVTFLIRTAALVGAGGQLGLWPHGSGYELDQQGFPALRWVVPVERR